MCLGTQTPSQLVNCPPVNTVQTSSAHSSSGSEYTTVDVEDALIPAGQAQYDDSCKPPQLVKVLVQKSSQALNSFGVAQKASVQCRAYKNTPMRASHIRLSRRDAANARVGRTLVNSSAMNEQHIGSPTAAQSIRSIDVHDPSSVLASGVYSHARLSVHPRTTGTQLPSSALAVWLKLNAAGFMHPYMTGMQLPIA